MEVEVVWVKLHVMVVKLEVVWVEVEVTGILVLLTKNHFVEKPALFTLHHLMEVKLMDYIHDPFFLHSYKFFHFV